MDSLEAAQDSIGMPESRDHATPALIGILGEFRGRTLVVVGGFLGLLAGTSSLLTFTFGVFAAQFGKEYHWSRGDMSLAVSCYSLVLFLGSAVSGRVADAVGAGRVGAVSMLAFGLSLIALPFFVHDIPSLWIGYILVTIAGLGTTPVVMLKPVMAAFAGQRGMASGLVLCGTGIGAIITPPLVNRLIELSGWRMGYTGLGCMALVIAPIIWMTLARRGPAKAASAVVTPKADLPGLTFREAAGRGEFWILSGIALFTTLAISGMIAHLVPFLRDLGASGAKAAGYASVLGFATIGGRLGSGFALDRLPARLAGLLFLAGGATGILLLVLQGDHLALPAILLVGLALGSEIDLLAYFISRYFGLRNHGSIFGWTYGVVALGSIFSPFLAGKLRDLQGNYSLAMWLMIGSLAFSCVLCLMLGRYRYAVK